MIDWDNWEPVVATNSYEWDQLVEDRVNPVSAARLMSVSVAEARKQMVFADERLKEREQKAERWRHHPNVYDAMLAWGEKGVIMRVKSRIRYERTIAIPQF